MKMKYFIGSVILLLILLFSCVNEFTDENYYSTNDSFSIEAAKAYFNKRITAFNVFPFTSITTRSQIAEVPKMTPQWKKGAYFKIDTTFYIEIPFDLGEVHITERKGKKKSTTTSPLKYRNAIYKFIAQRQGSDINFYVAVIIADDSYLVQNRNLNLSKVSLNNLDSFSGKIKYYNLEGNLVRGVIIKDGVSIGRVKGSDYSPTVILPGCDVEAKTRGWETNVYCEDHLYEVETCWYTGYQEGEDVFITDIECGYDYEWEEVCYEDSYWVDDETCPDCDGNHETEEAPGVSPISIPKILDKLKTKNATIKLFQKIKLDRIEVRKAPQNKPGQYGGCTKDGTIYLYDNVPENMCEMVLLEELVHRYQNDNPIHGEYKGNVEIEAKLLVWDYLREDSSVNGIKGSYGSMWAEFGEFAENPCEDTWSDATNALIRMGYATDKFPTSDYSHFKDDNYQNLK